MWHPERLVVLKAEKKLWIVLPRGGLKAVI